MHENEIFLTDPFGGISQHSDFIVFGMLSIYSDSWFSCQDDTQKGRKALICITVGNRVTWNSCSSCWCGCCCLFEILQFNNLAVSQHSIGRAFIFWGVVDDIFVANYKSVKYGVYVICTGSDKLHCCCFGRNGKKRERSHHQHHVRCWQKGMLNYV